MPNDDGHLIMDRYEKNIIISEYPEANHFIRKLLGSSEFIKGDERYCLWIEDDEVEMALNIPPIKRRIDLVKESRQKSKRAATNKLASKPWAFGEIRYKYDDFVLIPEVSSEKRLYVPVGYENKGTIVTNKVFAIYGGTLLIFGLMSSQIHNLWMKAVSGKLETRISYSSLLVYNTFPFPKISIEKKEEIKQAAEDVLVTREFYPDKTLADLYDPDKMPQDLREAHARLDDIVESCYPGYPFASDEARLECLFKLYEKMTANQVKK